MHDESFPPCQRCEHPMLSYDTEAAAAWHTCPACGAEVVVPFACPREVTFTIALSDTRP